MVTKLYGAIQSSGLETVAKQQRSIQRSKTGLMYEMKDERRPYGQLLVHENSLAVSGPGPAIGETTYTQQSGSIQTDKFDK
jgi:hypothetical protein